MWGTDWFEIVLVREDHAMVHSISSTGCVPQSHTDTFLLTMGTLLDSNFAVLRIRSGPRRARLTFHQEPGEIQES
jgi:hypothetical protein